MTLLKAIGEAILKGIQIVSGFTGAAQLAFPGATGTIQVVSKDLNEIGQVIVSAEAMGAALGLSGAQKLAAAAPQVEQIVLQSSILAGHQIANEALFKSAVQGIASNVADLLNSLKADAIQTQNKAA